MKPVYVSSIEARRRIRLLAEKQNVTLSTCSRVIGKSPGFLTRHFNGSPPDELDEGHRARLARFFGIDPSELGVQPPEDNPE